MLASLAESCVKNKFFVIEDDLDHQKIAEMSLMAAGITDITFFSTGEEAVEFFQSTGPGVSPSSLVILIDLMLPNISGFDILQFLKKDDRWQSSKMIVLSCSTSAKDREKSKQYGADAFFSKPLCSENINKILSS